MSTAFGLHTPPCVPEPPLGIVRLDGWARLRKLPFEFGFHFMPSVPHFPDRLRLHRNKLNLSQEQLGQRIGVSQNAISTWERGESSPQLPELLALAKLFEVAVHYLVGLADHPSGLPVGLFVIDEEKIESPKGLEEWGWQIPQRPRIVDLAEVRRIEAENDPAKRGKKKGSKA